MIEKSDFVYEVTSLITLVMNSICNHYNGDNWYLSALPLSMPSVSGGILGENIEEIIPPLLSSLIGQFYVH